MGAAEHPADLLRTSRGLRYPKGTHHDQHHDHRSVQALEADIRAWVKNWNDDPRPFIWTKSAEQILDSLARLLQRTTGAYARESGST